MNNDDKTTDLENVLILQGGGSLGAFACGVYKALVKNNIELDIVAGTSIGGVNAAIIAGSKDKEHTEQLLENFWLELAESHLDVDKINGVSSYFTAFIEPFFDYFQNTLPTNDLSEMYQNSKNFHDNNVEQLKSFYSSAVFGNEKMFKPRWALEYAWRDPEYFAPFKWTYLYDHSPLIKTLNKYIDYNKLNPSGNNTRLILTSVNILNAKPLTFDSSRQQIKSKHILATSAYPLYNFPWVEVENGVYAWDGGLLSNTPLREVLDASPIKNKRICLVENYPKNVKELPKNLAEVRHRARDIIFSDKTEHSVTMSKVITMYLDYIEELYSIVNNNLDTLNLDKKVLERIQRKYKKYKQDHGAEIKELFYVTREENNPHIFENADFSPQAIKQSIQEGEDKANETILNRVRKKSSKK